MEHGTTFKERHDDQLRDAWDVFQLRTGTRDADTFRRSYIGRYESREAFGQELLEQLGARDRLARLPVWLQGYLQFNGDAVVRDFEQAGHFWVHEDAASGAGCFVFDAFETANADQ